MLDKIGKIRENTLAAMEKSERNYKLAFLAAAAIEFLFFIAYLLLADLHDRMHLLLLISTIAIYTLIAFALLALSAHINRCTLRVLKAIESEEK